MSECDPYLKQLLFSATKRCGFTQLEAASFIVIAIVNCPSYLNGDSLFHFRTAQSECLNDKADHKVPIPEGKPGRLYDGNDQCVRMFGSGSRVCDIRDLKEV